LLHAIHIKSPAGTLAFTKFLFVCDPIVIAWLAVNVLDSLLTVIALRMGAVEISISYVLTGDLMASMALKYFAVFFMVIILVQIKRIHWLNWFVSGMLFVLSWNLTQIVCNI